MNAQNLVPNPSFEIYDTCPYYYTQIHLAIPWFQPGGKTFNDDATDYYNSCATNANLGVPANIEGFQYARTGNAYAGIFIYAYDEDRGYCEVMLTDSMIAGKKYCVEYYVSLAYPYDEATDNYHFYFSRDSLLYNGYNAIPVTPSVINQLGNYITDTLNWSKVSGTYIANGGERFLTIGNFYDNAHIDTIGGTNGSIYCYIDDVSVIDCGWSGIKEKENSSDFKIFPNPSDGIVNIEFDNPQKYEVIVCNLLGEKINTTIKQSKTGFTINLIEQLNDVYIINIQSNEISINKKIILIK
jgi:hypothetical protein